MQVIHSYGFIYNFFFFIKVFKIRCKYRKKERSISGLQFIKVGQKNKNGEKHCREEIMTLFRWNETKV